MVIECKIVEICESLSNFLAFCPQLMSLTLPVVSGLACHKMKNWALRKRFFTMIIVTVKVILLPSVCSCGILNMILGGGNITIFK